MNKITTDSNSTEPKQQEYQSMTLNSNNLVRHNFLPIFPAPNIFRYGVLDPLLLANVPSSYFVSFLKINHSISIF